MRREREAEREWLEAWGGGDETGGGDAECLVCDWVMDLVITQVTQAEKETRSRLLL